MVTNIENKDTEIRNQIKRSIEALEDKKAENVVIIKMPDEAAITSYFVIASGNSEAQLKAMKNAVDDALDVKHGKINQANTGWHVIDFFDFVVHLFSSEKRAYYNLESLWKDGDLIKTADL